MSFQSEVSVQNYPMLRYRMGQSLDMAVNKLGF